MTKLLRMMFNRHAIGNHNPIQFYIIRYFLDDFPILRSNTYCFYLTLPLKIVQGFVSVQNIFIKLLCMLLICCCCYILIGVVNRNHLRYKPAQ